MSTIPTLAANATLPSTNYNAIANQLNQMIDFIRFAPSGSTSTPASGGPTLWVTLGNLTVPTWATKARLTIHGLTIAGASNASTITPKLGTVSGQGERWDNTGTGRFNCSSSHLLTGISTGSQSLTLLGTFIVGTLTADTSSAFDVDVVYLG